MSPGDMAKMRADMDQTTGTPQGGRCINCDSKLAAAQLLQDAVVPTVQVTAALSTARLPYSTTRAYLMHLNQEDTKATAVPQDFVNRDTPPTAPTTPLAALHLTQPQVNTASKVHTSIDCCCGVPAPGPIVQPTPPYIAPAPPLLATISSQPPPAPVPRQVAMAEMATAPTRSNSVG